MIATPRGTERRTALGITAIYLAVGTLWIIFSDRFVASLVTAGASPPTDMADLTLLQSIKGTVFMVGTSAMLYVLIARGMAAVHAADRRAHERALADAARYQKLIERTSEEAQRHQRTQASLQEQLRQSQKMEAVGLLAGGVAHDFNNVLTAIMGHSELALAHVTGNDAARVDIDNIRQSAELAGGLTRQLLAFSRKQVLQPRRIDLNEVLSDMGRMLPRVLGEHIRLELAVDTQPAVVLADISQIEQVILNLCVNARDAMPAGGRLFLRISRDAAAASGDPGVVLTVGDEGHGMDEATRGRIFEPFFTTKPPGHGTGLGLSTVYGIVQQTGGSITCASEPGRGAVFRIVLPSVPAEVDSDEAGAPRVTGRESPPRAAQGACTLLVVDDDPHICSVLRELLGSAGFSVLTAPDGAKALSLLRTSCVDLVLCDMLMPGKEGIETCTEIKRTHPGLPFVAMSGAPGGSNYLRIAIRLGAVGGLHKPFSAQELLAVVHQALGADAVPDSSRVLTG